MNLYLIQRVFHALYVRRFIFRSCRCVVHHRERLPKHGPAIFVSNHASNGDTMIIQLLYPDSMLSSVRPTGARDYFVRNRIAYWAARDIMRVCFLDRESGERAKGGEDVFTEFREPLNDGGMLIYFPQGTRSGKLFRTGVYHLARTFPDVPIIPALLRGTGEMFPPGAKWPKPHPVSVYVGEEFPFDETLTPREYAKKLEEYVFSLDRES